MNEHSCRCFTWLVAWQQLQDAELAGVVKHAIQGQALDADARWLSCAAFKVGSARRSSTLMGG